MKANRKIRVLQTIRQGKIGGGETHVLDLVSTLDREQFEPVVLSFTDGPMVDALRRLEVPIHVIHSEKAFDLRVWDQVRQFILRERIDLIHMHGTRASTNILWPARRLHLPVIYTVHGWSFHDGLNPLSRWARITAEKYITRKTQANICVSESNRQTGIRAFGSFRSEVVRNGVNLRKFDRDQAFHNVRAAYGIPDHHVVLAFIARMTLQKDPNTMISGFAAALKQHPHMTLLMIGDGELKEEAMRTAKMLGVEGRVIFDGFRQDVPAVLQSADIYCLPSLWEGFPIGVLEAMAMGKAVIASDVDGTREAVTNGENGLLVPAKDTAALSDAILRVARDNEFRRELGDRAVERIRSTYSVEGMTRQIEAIYEQVYNH
ncbi:glycosyltransferase family 4 protein [Chitinophaga lutea]